MCPAEGRGEGASSGPSPTCPTAHPGLPADKELTRVTGGHVLRKCRHVLGRGGASLPGKWMPPRTRRPEGAPAEAVRAGRGVAGGDPSSYCSGGPGTLRSGRGGAGLCGLRPSSTFSGKCCDLLFLHKVSTT